MNGQLKTKARKKLLKLNIRPHGLLCIQHANQHIQRHAELQLRNEQRQKKKTTTNKSSGKKYVFYDPDDFWDYDEAEDYYDEL